MDLKEIQNLIKFVANSGVAEVKLEMDDVKITIRTTLEGNVTETTYVQQMPAQATLPQAAAPQQIAPVAAAPEVPVVENAHYITIKSPIIGTFYRKPSPDKPMFVEVGKTISKGDVLCVIEAMKLFNEIESEVSGKIVKILVDDMSPVEFDQPLFLVDPS
ncbi:MULTISPECIES: acetyl-CoA carboxylase biotin carboxyl carrier protein [Flavobacterium]|jgi:acetyl-CoA carboxylase biotin carboxyl carrier protein|uniref:Biotin carboxyl carrier protein of acetyl-CoA carboxylase n=1 Tax=Flavobacterium algoritolerans TaxID=3041254 RepID=A0ABT6V6L2_9FLAO|nr:MULTISPECIES: acetyl-CoA carboxylase biotin carboxyl carrier protein [Flavobacterium]MDI5886864.1 acetyl-CoA carboxylase biotin carboxyl carrier protein [Flavobacterium yafengii]MDI5893878.1 acetyl-CoA carboxylase biotin carboxyl carrier protein [Flavobacterium algoritolerans]MDI6050932.1 acetyl-CoA carboxylase biotin carboxyl carrier protein [Flavobacterium sp. XS2P24]MDP3680819.1 acetyl-CoA carboxylase biotin carboxyl carrier protein [Flavobacterium sp.]PIF61553.1 acetyl-CoA carboxylase b